MLNVGKVDKTPVRVNDTYQWQHADQQRPMQLTMSLHASVEWWATHLPGVILSSTPTLLALSTLHPILKS